MMVLGGSTAAKNEMLSEALAACCRIGVSRTGVSAVFVKLKICVNISLFLSWTVEDLYILWGYVFDG